MVIKAKKIRKASRPDHSVEKKIRKIDEILYERNKVIRNLYGYLNETRDDGDTRKEGQCSWIY